MSNEDNEFGIWDFEFGIWNKNLELGT